MITNQKRSGLGKRAGWLMVVLGAVWAASIVMVTLQAGHSWDHAAIGAVLPFLILIIGLYYTRIFQRTSAANVANPSGDFASSASIGSNAEQPRMQYGGFWRRFGAMWLDVIILSPLIILTLWGNSASRLFQIYYLIPGLAIGVTYSIYLVKRFGGTPGKWILQLRITKLDGSSVGYREAILRELPSYFFHIILSTGLAISALNMTDAEYLSLAWNERSMRLQELAPAFYSPVQIAQTVWIWSEFIVLLTNEKKRAIHDFIAGTVVIVKKSNQSVQRTQAAAQPPPLT